MCCGLFLINLRTDFSDLIHVLRKLRTTELRHTERTMGFRQNARTAGCRLIHLVTYRYLFFVVQKVTRLGRGLVRFAGLVAAS